MSLDLNQLSIEKNILAGLLNETRFSSSVMPYLKPEYFEERTVRLAIEEIVSYGMKYEAVPSKEAIVLETETRNDIDGEDLTEVSDLLTSLTTNHQKASTSDIEWLYDSTEKYFRDRALYLAIKQSIKILDGDAKEPKTILPDILSDALSVSFDSSVGHDFIEDAPERWDFYHQSSRKYPFDMELLNQITNGGAEDKTLNLIMAGTGVGKTIFLCHLAASYLAAGQDVLYVTLEMASEKIAERIDANLLNVDIEDVGKLPKDMYLDKIEKLKHKTTGKLFVKEYPTTTASSATIEALLHELKIKKSTKPKILIIDYLNICASRRIKSSVDSYSYVKSIVEEMRGLCQKHELVGWTATQVNRSGMTNSDFGMENTSDSVGMVFTCDLIWALISTDELEQEGKILLKQLKNRYRDINYNKGSLKKVVLGLDKPHMKFYDTKPSENYSHTKQGQKAVVAHAPWEKRHSFAGFKI